MSHRIRQTWGQKRGVHTPAGKPFRKAKRRHSSSALIINLAPMIDITFLLLIFFLVTSTFKRAEGYLSARLPKDMGQPTVALPISPIIIHVEQYGEKSSEYRLRVENFINAPATFGELTEFLINVQGNPGFDKTTPVVIAAEPDVAWDHVVNCWNAALRADCKSISFGRQGK